MRADELEKIAGAMARFAEAKIEHFESTPFIDEGCAISREDYDILRPFLVALKETRHCIGNVEVKVTGRTFVGAIVSDDKAYISLNKRRKMEIVMDFQDIIEYLYGFKYSIKCEELYKEE